MATSKADSLSRAVDALLGIEVRKTAVTDPEVQRLLRVAHLRRRIARARAARGAEERLLLWKRLAPTLRGR